MQTFVVAKECLIFFGAIEIPKERLPRFLQSYQKLINWIHIGVVFVLLWLCMISSIFEMRSGNEDVSEAVFFALIVAYLIALYSILVWKGSKMVDLMADLNEAIEIRNRRSTNAIRYKHTMEVCEGHAKFFFNIMVILVELLILLFIANSLYLYYFTLSSSKDSFWLLYPSTFPWNCTTPNGYLMAMFTQTIWANIAVPLVILSLIIFLEFCILFRAMTMDICECLKQFNESMLSIKNMFDIENRVQSNEILKDVFQFHADVKQFIACFQSVFGAITTLYFALATAFLTKAILLLTAAIFKLKAPSVLRLFTVLIFVIQHLMVLCFFGDYVTSGFEEIAMTICQFEWYEYPIEMQKIFQTILIAVQTPTYIRGLKNLKCTREVFKGMTNTFYMILVLNTEMDRLKSD